MILFHNLVPEDDYHEHHRQDEKLDCVWKYDRVRYVKQACKFENRFLLATKERMVKLDLALNIHPPFNFDSLVSLFQLTSVMVKQQTKYQQLDCIVDHNEDRLVFFKPPELFTTLTQVIESKNWLTIDINHNERFENDRCK